MFHFAAEPGFFLTLILAQRRHGITPSPADYRGFAGGDNTFFQANRKRRARLNW